MTKPRSPQSWIQLLGRYREPDVSRSVFELLITAVLRDYPQLASIGRVTFLQSLRCAALALWDEDQRRLISFRELCVDRPVRRQLSARPISGEAPL
jgi:hypothetical protein